MTRLLFAAMFTVLCIQPAFAESVFRIGFIGPLSGPVGSLGQEALDGVRLAIKSGKLGGVRTDLIATDDQIKPDVGLQQAYRLMDQEHVDLVVVGSLSNVLLAVAPKVFAEKKILLSTVAGASQLAGKGCNPYYFNTSFQNDGPPEAAAQAMQSENIQKAVFIAPNYQGGRDTLVGFKRVFKGSLGELFTSLDQSDYAGYIAQIRAAAPDGLYFFLPAEQGIKFLKQWQQSGVKDLRLFTHNAVDQTMLPAIGDAAIGLRVVTQWAEGMDNAANREFVAAFEQTYHRIPSIYAALSYDGMRLVASALTQLGDGPYDGDRIKKALETAKFSSIRGNFRLNSNHYPIEDYYMTTVTKDPEGAYHFAIEGKIFADLQDPYSSECKMN